jgi:aminopeptidase N
MEFHTPRAHQYFSNLVAHVGRDNFIAGLRKYFAKHAYANTELSDLITELEATSGKDLTAWVATWLRTAGVNTLRPVIALDGDKYASVAVKQEVPLIPAGSKELRPHRLYIGLFDIKGDALTRRESIEVDIAGDLTEIKELAGKKAADLLLINDHDQTYAKLRFDDRSVATMKKYLGNSMIHLPADLSGLRFGIQLATANFLPVTTLKSP